MAVPPRWWKSLNLQQSASRTKCSKVGARRAERTAALVLFVCPSKCVLTWRRAASKCSKVGARRAERTAALVLFARPSVSPQVSRGWYTFPPPNRLAEIARFNRMST
eukprot:926313-Pyramimonas_sp.AAC.1